MNLSQDCPTYMHSKHRLHVGFLVPRGHLVPVRLNVIWDMTTLVLSHDLRNERKETTPTCPVSCYL